MSVQADYIWNANRRELISFNTNLTYNPTTGANYPFSDLSRRAWPLKFNVTPQWFSSGQSNNHALETALTKRFSRRWQGAVTYTLSSFRDFLPPPVSGRTVVTFPVASDLGNSWAYAGGDQRHRAVFNGIVDLPFALQVSGIYLYGSGQIFPASYGQDLRDQGSSASPGGLLRPDGTIVPRDELRGKPIHRLDARVVKSFPLGGRVKAEGSFEVFNLFNHANFGNYVTNEISPKFGQPVQNLNVAYLPRMLQLGFRFMF
jgi:hypothetical protein